MPNDALMVGPNEPTRDTGEAVMASGLSSRKATHRGTCQACNCVHKLPRSVIAKHGYIIDSYTFVGTCPGSLHPPYQVSCEYARACLLVKQRELASLQEQDALLRQSAVEATCYVSEAQARRYGERQKSIWRYVDIKWDGKNVYHVGMDGKELRHVGAAVGTKTLLDVASQFNLRYADAVIAKEILHAQRYVDWQAQRIANWSPASLLPLDGKVIYEPFNSPPRSI